MYSYRKKLRDSMLKLLCSLYSWKYIKVTFIGWGVNLIFEVETVQKIINQVK